MGIFQNVSGQIFGSLGKQNRVKLIISKQVINFHSRGTSKERRYSFKMLKRRSFLLICDQIKVNSVAQKYYSEWVWWTGDPRGMATNGVPRSPSKLYNQGRNILNSS